jgi:hypothetical protein
MKEIRDHALMIGGQLFRETLAPTGRQHLCDIWKY